MAKFREGPHPGEGTISISEDEWAALLAFYSDMKDTLESSYAVPFKPDQWEEEYKQQHPEAYDLYAGAATVIHNIRKAQVEAR